MDNSINYIVSGFLQDITFVLLLLYYIVILVHFCWIDGVWWTPFLAAAVASPLIVTPLYGILLMRYELTRALAMGPPNNLEWPTY
jgi:hypothetical protein